MRHLYGLHENTDAKTCDHLPKNTAAELMILDSFWYNIFPQNANKSGLL